jgi:hypothetical protein
VLGIVGLKTLCVDGFEDFGIVACAKTTEGRGLITSYIIEVDYRPAILINSPSQSFDMAFSD